MNAPVETPLQYAHGLADPQRRRLASLALGLSLVSPALLGISVGMFLLAERSLAGMDRVRGVQVFLAWMSIALGVVAPVTAIIAMTRNPRGGREIAALTASLVHATLVLAAFKYL